MSRSSVTGCCIAYAAHPLVVLCLSAQSGPSLLAGQLTASGAPTASGPTTPTVDDPAISAIAAAVAATNASSGGGVSGVAGSYRRHRVRTTEHPSFVTLFQCRRPRTPQLIPCVCFDFRTFR